MNITIDDFVQYFRPKINDNASEVNFQGKLSRYAFATNGDGFAMVQRAYQAAPDCIWTVVNADTSTPIVCSGFHSLNRLAYVVTEITCPAGVAISVVENMPFVLHRYACFARYNGVSPGIQSILDAVGNQTYETYSAWLNRMMNMWSAETMHSRLRMTGQLYEEFDKWLDEYVKINVGEECALEVEDS
jgi:hypothetical protein